jgi:hypothetical protein
VTQGSSEICNADAALPAVERENGPTVREKLQSAITFGNGLWVRSRGYWTLPPLLTEQPPTAEKIAEYADRAAYTGEAGIRRAAGVGWCRIVAVPQLVASRLWAWLWERPGRFFSVAATVKLLSFLPPAAWAVDHLFTPAARFALWLFV